jgi:hypothetical protein
MYDHSAVRSTGWSEEFKTRLPIKRIFIFLIWKGEHLQEMPRSTLLPKKGEPPIFYLHGITESRLLHTGNGHLRINK